MSLFSRAASGAGSNRQQGSNSLSGFLSTLVPVFIVAAISIALWLLLRRKFHKIYYPRTERTIVHASEYRTPSQAKAFSWATDVKGLPDELVLQRNSLDGYLFLRFFKLLIFISGLGCLITWPILFPVNATGHGDQTQLDVLSFSNVVNVNRYYAHAFVAWIFLGLVTLAVFHERLYFIGLREAYLTSPTRAARLPSRTVLFMGIPKDQRSQAAVRQALGSGVRNIYMTTDCKKLEENVQDREKAHGKLEGACVKASKQANKLRLKTEKKSGARPDQGQNPRQWLQEKKRPTHRLKPLIGKKVDTINWGREEIPRLNREIRHQQQQQNEGNVDHTGGAFVEFASQAAAQRAFQNALKGSKKKAWQPRYIDVQPDEIIWKNLGETYLTRKIKMTIALAAISTLILFWTPITAFVGAITNINYLVDQVPFLSFITNLPDVILGVVTGLLPTIILAVVVILFPILCRLLAKLAGEPTLSAVELKTQNWYMAFQVIQVFLITTFSSGAAAVAAQIFQKPTSAPTLLAQNLPKASNFYICYFILYGLAQAAAHILNIVPLLLFVVLGKFLDSTPRKQYNRWISLAGLGWGSEYPKWTNLGVIALAYSCIAPLVLGFAVVGFTFLYLAFRYQWLFTLGNKFDMKGASYRRALQHLMVGVYLSTICLIGLFAIGTSGSSAGSGPLVLMIIFLVALTAFHFIADRTLKPLEECIPLRHCSDRALDCDDQDAPERVAPRGVDHTCTHPEDGLHGRPDRNIGRSANGATGQGLSHESSSRSAPEKSRPSDENEKTGNKLTQKVIPFIDRKFLEPNRDTRFELPEIDYSNDEAYRNPAITAQEPFTWLARDGCGVSRLLVDENRRADLQCADDFAWFDDKNKLHWDHDRVDDVATMLEHHKVPKAEDRDRLGE